MALLQASISEFIPSVTNKPLWELLLSPNPEGAIQSFPSFVLKFCPQTLRWWVSFRLPAAAVRVEGRSLVKANETTSSAKSREAILTSQNRTFPYPQRCLEILSMYITKTIGDKGKPCNTHEEHVWLSASKIDTDFKTVVQDRSIQQRFPEDPPRGAVDAYSTSHVDWMSPSKTLQGQEVGPLFHWHDRSTLFLLTNNRLDPPSLHPDTSSPWEAEWFDLILSLVGHSRQCPDFHETSKQRQQITCTPGASPLSKFSNRDVDGPFHQSSNSDCSVTGMKWGLGIR